MSEQRYKRSSWRESQFQWNKEDLGLSGKKMDLNGVWQTRNKHLNRIEREEHECSGDLECFNDGMMNNN